MQRLAKRQSSAAQKRERGISGAPSGRNGAEEMWTLEDQEFDYIDVDRQNESLHTSDELRNTGLFAK